MTLVLLRLCCSVAVTSLTAVTSAWTTEQKPGSLKDEQLMMLYGELLAVVKKPVPTPCLVREPSVLSVTHYGVIR